MTPEIIEARKESSQRELQACTAELQKLTQRSEELSIMIHNLKVQLATYEDLLTDDTPDTEAEVRETIESLVGE